MTDRMDIELVLSQGDALGTDAFNEAMKTIGKSRNYNGSYVFLAANALLESHIKMKKN